MLVSMCRQTNHRRRDGQAVRVQRHKNNARIGNQRSDSQEGRHQNRAILDTKQTMETAVPLPRLWEDLQRQNYVHTGAATRYTTNTGTYTGRVLLWTSKQTMHTHALQPQLHTNTPYRRRRRDNRPRSQEGVEGSKRQQCATLGFHALYWGITLHNPKHEERT